MITSFLQLHFLLALFLVPVDQPEEVQVTSPDNSAGTNLTSSVTAIANSSVDLTDDGDDPVAVTDDDNYVAYERQGTIVPSEARLIRRGEKNAKGRSPPLSSVCATASSEKLILLRAISPFLQFVRPLLPRSYNNLFPKRVGSGTRFSAVVPSINFERSGTAPGKDAEAHLAILVSRPLLESGLFERYSDLSAQLLGIRHPSPLCRPVTPVIYFIFGRALETKTDKANESGCRPLRQDARNLMCGVHFIRL